MMFRAPLLGALQVYACLRSLVWISVFHTMHFHAWISVFLVCSCMFMYEFLYFLHFTYFLVWIAVSHTMHFHIMFLRGRMKFRLTPLELTPLALTSFVRISVDSAAPLVLTPFVRNQPDQNARTNRAGSDKPNYLFDPHWQTRASHLLLVVPAVNYQHWYDLTNLLARREPVCIKTHAIKSRMSRVKHPMLRLSENVTT